MNEAVLDTHDQQAANNDSYTVRIHFDFTAQPPMKRPVLNLRVLSSQPSHY